MQLLYLLALLAFLASSRQGNAEKQDPLAIWRGALRLEGLNPALAFSLLREDTAAVELCKLPLGSEEDVPSVHYMLFLYFKSADLTARRGLVRLMTKCIEEFGADVTNSYGKDPSVLFKALLLREMSLAKVVAEASGNQTDGLQLITRSALSQLYSVPCEVVPLSKLLLHASTIIGKSSLSKVGGLDGLKHLIAGASLGGQNKPAVRGGDLSMAPSYHEILGAGDFAAKGYRLQLKELIRVLDEVAGVTHGSILASVSARSQSGLAALVFALAEVEESTLRNLLHQLAVAGATLMIRQLADFVVGVAAAGLESAPASESALQKLAAALLTKDRHGMIPAAYAAMRFGEHSEAFGAFVQLCAAAGGPVTSEACRVQHPEIAISKARTGINVGHGSITVGADGEIKELSAQKRRDEEDSGGWNTRRLEQSNLAGDPERCDILQFQGPPPSRDEFYRQFVLTNTPVVFRGAAQGTSMQQAFRREAFLQRYGANVVEVGAIPYPTSFGVIGSAATLENVANFEVADTVSDQLPDYAFTTPSPRWRAQLSKDCPLPDYVPISSTTQGSGSDREIQFFLGPAGSGAPVHFHGHAVNTMAFGEKRWFLYPPGQAFYSTLPAIEFAKNHSSPALNEAWQCTQRSGDVMFVPTLWSHATLNVKQSIGVAHEFSIEPFCME